MDTPLKDIIKPIILHASQIILSYYTTDLSVDYKSQNLYDAVTVADREVDEYIRNEIHKLFPADTLLSEENSSIPDAYDGRVWMIDPLDGTKYFVDKSSGFAILIGLCINGHSWFGMVCNPLTGEIWTAQKDQGAYYCDEKGERQIILPTTRGEQNMILATGAGHYQKAEQLVKELGITKRFSESGCGLKMCGVADGRYSIYLHESANLSKWDTCAGHIIVEEAGGVVLDFTLHSLNYAQPSVHWPGGICATNPILLEKIKKR